MKAVHTKQCNCELFLLKLNFPGHNIQYNFCFTPWEDLMTLPIFSIFPDLLSPLHLLPPGSSSPPSVGCKPTKASTWWRSWLAGPNSRWPTLLSSRTYSCFLSVTHTPAEKHSPPSCCFNDVCSHRVENHHLTAGFPFLTLSNCVVEFHCTHKPSLRNVDQAVKITMWSKQSIISQSKQQVMLCMYFHSSPSH